MVLIVHLLFTMLCWVVSLLIAPGEWQKDPRAAVLLPLILLVDLAAFYPVLLWQRAPWARVALVLYAPFGLLLLLPSARSFTGAARPRVWWTTLAAGLACVLAGGGLVTLVARPPTPGAAPSGSASIHAPRPQPSPPAEARADVERLLALLSQGVRPEAELREAAGQLTRLALRQQLPPEERRRWIELLGQRIVSETPGFWSEYATISAWGDLDRVSLEAELWRRYERDGRLPPVLWSAAQRDARRVATDARPAWAALLERIARAEVERGRVPLDVAWCWILADRDAARTYFEALGPETLTPAGRQSLVGVLTQLAAYSPSSLDRLRRLAGGGDPASRRARRVLMLFGEGPQDEIEVAARRWREEHSREALYRLCNDYIDGLPEGMPFERWLERLGEDPRRRGDFHIQAGSPDAAIYLEVNPEGRLIGRSCGD